MKLSKILTVIGIIIFALGGALIESDQMAIPVIMALTGMSIIFIASRILSRYEKIQNR